MSMHSALDELDTRPMISIVTPVFNEEDAVEECYSAVRELFAESLDQYRYEHIFADNCSSDRTVEILRSLAAADDRVKVILNARNFGPQRSVWNAMLAARGNAIIPCLAVDLQDPPAVIPELIRHWREGAEIVHGIRAGREEGWLLHFVRRLYYRGIKYAANVDIPLNSGEFQLIDRKVLKVLSEFEDHYPYVRGMIASCGFRQAQVPYTMVARRRGISKAALYGMIDIGLNGLVSLSNLPMRVCMGVGFVVSLLSLVFALVSLVLATVSLVMGWGVPSAGIPTLIVGLFFFGGVQLFFLGVMGEYISAIHSQVRKRPVVIERERINFQLLDSKEQTSELDCVDIGSER